MYHMFTFAMGVFGWLKCLTFIPLLVFCTVIKAALEEFVSVLDDGPQKQQLLEYLGNI